ncbi:Reverse transcriptase domain-containing protein [Abeliophyllum distichum]|uniref:Reverse transcriptase domain-containing protein n=1 Tax=Abeliophyllum distichum TaxID=126358 RepID=A0ABD1RT49_9LAMI
MEPRRIIWRVYHTISLLHTGRLFRHIHWRGDMDIAPLFGVIITTPSPPPPTLVFWRTPPVGSYKINTDGCVKDGVASGGGIIRLWVQIYATWNIAIQPKETAIGFDQEIHQR